MSTQKIQFTGKDPFHYSNMKLALEITQEWACWTHYTLGNHLPQSHPFKVKRLSLASFKCAYSSYSYFRRVLNNYLLLRQVLDTVFPKQIIFEL